MTTVFTKEWFDEHQSKLLKLANTRYGRFLFRIHGKRSSVGKHKITKITPSSIEWVDGKRYAEFRTNNKYALRLYFGLKPIWHLFHAFDMNIANKLAPQLNVGFDTFYPDASPGATSVDGDASKQISSGAPFLVFHFGSGNGYGGNNNSTIGAHIFTYPIDDYYLQVRRGFTFFDTSSLPDDSVIVTAELSLYGATKLNTFVSSDLHIAGTTSTHATTIDQSDYNKVTRTSFGSVDYSTFSTSGYNDITLNSSGRAAVQNTGLSRFSQQIGFDINYNAPSHTETSTKVISYTYESADAAGTSTDPKLVVSYSLDIDFAGTMTFGSSLDYTISTTTNISGSMDFSMQLAIFSLIAEDIEKTYLYKVYDKDDNFIGIWRDVKSQFTFKHQINTAGSSIRVTLARSADRLEEVREALKDHTGTNILDHNSEPIIARTISNKTVGSGTDVDLGHKIIVQVFYGSIEPLFTHTGGIITDHNTNPILAGTGAPNGKNIFQGYIESYDVSYGQSEETEVILNSFGAELENEVYKDGSDTTVSVTSESPSDTFKDIIDGSSTPISYTTASVDEAGTSVSYDFRLNTRLEALNQNIKLSPDDYFWFIDQGQNIAYMKEKSSTADHTFILGKHIKELRFKRTLEGLANEAYVAGGGDPQLLKYYSDATSLTDYPRKGLHIITDSRVELAATAETKAKDRLIERNKTPNYASKIVILDKVYDIETIKVGDSVGFANFGNFIDDLVLQIVELNYSKTQVTLLLDRDLPQIDKRIEDIQRNLKDEKTKNVPDTPS